MGAHEMIRIEHEEAEGIIRLHGEYETIARITEEERWNELLARSGLTNEHLEQIRESSAYGPLLSALRGAKARGIDIDDDFRTLVTERQLDDAEDIAALLANRLASWTHKHGSRRIGATNLIAGLIPRATEVTDPDLGQALIERERAIEERAIALAERAIEERAKWVQLLGQMPSDPTHQAAWLANVATIAAYRERWNITGNTVIGKELDVDSIEQLGQWRRASSAVKAAVRLNSEPVRVRNSGNPTGVGQRAMMSEMICDCRMNQAASMERE
jgi:hypothetical protein